MKLYISAIVLWILTIISVVLTRGLDFLEIAMSVVVLANLGWRLIHKYENSECINKFIYEDVDDAIDRIAGGNDEEK